MEEGQLKRAFRLNRNVALALVGYGLLGFGSGAPVLLWLGVGGLVLNTLLQRRVQRIPAGEVLLREKWGVWVPLWVGGLTAGAYLLAGRMELLVLMLLPVLEAQYFGHPRLSRLLMGGALLIFLLGLGLGYPLTAPIEAAATALPSMVSAGLRLLPVFVLFFQFGDMLAALVRNTHHQMHHLQSLAATDALTGLINRRQFNQQLQSEILRARRHPAALSLALFDIDDFKRINDFYGHPVGDRILKELGRLIAENIRGSDICARYGGEEFALILPETRQVEAAEILERLRGLVERTVFCLPDTPLTMTLSIGVAQFDKDNQTSFELVEQADAALYEAKRQGKNRVIYGITPSSKLSPPLRPPRQS